MESKSLNIGPRAYSFQPRWRQTAFYAASVLTLTVVVGLPKTTPVLASNQEANRSRPQHYTLKGTATYHERIGLPRDAILRLTLVDEDSRREISIQTVSIRGRQVPIAFVFRYSGSLIDPNHTYAAQVDILFRNKVIFFSDNPTQVLTKGNPSRLDVTLQRSP
jgi:putative lipoprotein